VTKEVTPGTQTEFSFDQSGNRASKTTTYAGTQTSAYQDVHSEGFITYDVETIYYLYNEADELLTSTKVWNRTGSIPEAEFNTVYTYDNNCNELEAITTYRDNYTQTSGSYGLGMDSLNHLDSQVTRTFDAYNRLIRQNNVSVQGDSTTVEYTYNGLDERMTRRVTHNDGMEGSTTVHTAFTYDRSYVVAESYSGHSTGSKTYTKGLQYISTVDEVGIQGYYFIIM
jgi:YD repeat-containing protein